MNNVSVTGHTPDRDHETPHTRESYDLISIVTLFHLYSFSRSELATANWHVLLLSVYPLDSSAVIPFQSSSGE
jgi:hypothetical protein